MMEMRKLTKQNLWNCSTSFWQVSLPSVHDQRCLTLLKGIVIVTLIPKIVASSITLVATSISSEIRIYTVEALSSKPLTPIGSILWQGIKTYKTLSKAAKYYGQKRRIILLRFQSNSENSSRISFPFFINLHFSWTSVTATWPRDWLMASPPSMILALSTTLQNDREVRGRFAPGSLRKLPAKNFRFPLAFLRNKKTEASHCYLQHLGTKLKLVNIGK